MSFVPPAAPAVPADAYGLPTLAPTSTPADFIHWWKNLILFAGNLKDGLNVEHGLLGLIMTPAQYATLPQAAAAPFFRYGVVPIQVIANDAAGTRDVQKQQAADQAIQNANITKLDRAIMASVKIECFDQLAPGAPNGLYGINIFAKVTHLRVTLGTPKPAQLTELRAHMNRPAFPSTPVSVIIKDLNDACEVFDLANFPIDNRARVEALQDAVRQMPHLTFTLDTFQERFPTTALQLYPALCTMLLDADANKRPVTAVEMGMLMRDIPRAYAATAPTMKPATAKPAAKSSSKLYCWKHGPGAHASIDCKVRDTTPGFNLTATLADPKGGRTERWISRRSADASN